MILFATGQYINWSTPSLIQNMAERTIMGWINPSSINNGNGIASSGSLTPPAEFWEVVLSNNKLGFQAGWTFSGFWRSDTSISTDAWTHFAVTYDKSSVLNDPLIYINGDADLVTEVSSPSGTYLSGTGGSFYLGASLTGGVNKSFVGKIACFYVIPRILSAAEIADAYNSRLAIPNYNGLVFAPNLVGAKGLQTFDGATLSSSNTMIDNISGAVGTPSGNPVGAADTYLTYEG